MEMMASMQKTMELLTMKMTTHETLLILENDSESVRKQHKQGPSPTKTAQERNVHTSNSGTDSPSAKPPDPLQEDIPQTTDTQPMDSNDTQSMESFDSEINGGITDADISTAMHDDATTQSPTFAPSSPINTISPTASDEDEL